MAGSPVAENRISFIREIFLRIFAAAQIVQKRLPVRQVKEAAHIIVIVGFRVMPALDDGGASALSPENRPLHIRKDLAAAVRQCPGRSLPGLQKPARPIPVPIYADPAPAGILSQPPRVLRLRETHAVKIIRQTAGKSHGIRLKAAAVRKADGSASPEIALLLEAGNGLLLFSRQDIHVGIDLSQLPCK